MFENNFHVRFFYVEIIWQQARIEIAYHIQPFSLIMSLLQKADLTLKRLIAVISHQTASLLT